MPEWRKHHANIYLAHTALARDVEITGIHGRFRKTRSRTLERIAEDGCGPSTETFDDALVGGDAPYLDSQVDAYGSSSALEYANHGIATRR